MSLIDGLDKFSNTAKSLAVSAVGGDIAGAASVAGAKPWIALGVGLALLGLVITVFFEVLKRRKTSRGDALSRNLVSRGDVGPKFTAGVESFRKQGKSLYDIPWYLMVGEQGAGKTYAIKHSNIRFIPGMNEPDAGKSGTIGMDWWFAYNAVLLDTAGALLTNPEKTDQFREFLRLLRRCRPQLPINGMILAIPATALLSDTDGQMQAKAELIAQQFEFIQRELAIRFPVYVIITKSDQIEGFREYFYNFSDSSISNQIFGWSNPSSLDTAFQAEQVGKYLADVTTAIKRRRLTLLDDPKTPEDRTKRIDQTDALYAFPEQMTHVNGRLRYYLETVFMPGQWSSAPLFLRGIYFTSAVSEGSALDSDLAAALKVLPADLPPSLRVWEKNKSYFLRDLFNEKIFREKGLVTPSSTKNVDGQLRRQRAVVLGAGFAAVALLAAFTAYAYVQLDKSIGRFDTFWSTADDKDSLPPLSKVTWSEPPAPAATPSYYTENAALGTRNVGDKFDFMFAVPKLFVTNVDEQRKTAHRLLFEQCVLKPLYQRAADTLAREPNKKLWETLKTGVPKDEQLRAKQQAYVDLLGQLILVEAWISDTQGHVTANLQRPNFTAMFDALGKLADKSDKPDDWLKAIKDSFSQFYIPGDKTDWAPKTIWPADSAARGNLATAVEDAIGRIDAYGRSYADQSALDAVADAMVAYQDSEDKFAGVLKSAETIAKPEEFEPWHGKVTLPVPTALEDSLESLQTRLRGSAGKHLDELHGQAVIESGQVKDWNVVLRAYTGIIGTEAGDTLAGKTAQALGRGAEEINRIEKKSTHSDEELKRLDQRLLGEAPERFGADDAKWSYVRRRAAYEAVRKFLLQANLESVNLDNLAKSGDDLAANRKAVGDLTAVDSATARPAIPPWIRPWHIGNGCSGTRR